MRTIVYFLTIALCTATLNAQDLIQTQLRAISLAGAISDLDLMTAEGPVAFEVPVGRRSASVAYSGLSTISFIRKGSFASDGSPPEIVAQATVSSNYRRPLLIFVPKGAAYRIVVIEDDLKRLSGGSVLFANLSPYPLAVIMGENGRLQLKPGQMELRHFKAENVNVRVRAASMVGQELKKGMDTRIFPLPKFRDICFIYPDGLEDSGSVKMRTLREHVLTAQRAYATQP